MKVFAVVASLFAVLLFAYWLKRRRVFQATDVKVVNRILVEMALPAYIFTAIYGHDVSPEMFRAALVFICMEVVVFVSAWLAGKWLRWPAVTLGVAMSAAAFGNTGYLGYPVTEVIYGGGAAAAAAVIYDRFGMAIPLFTLGAVSMIYFGGTGQSKWKEIRDFLSSPLFWLLPLVLLVNYWHITVPEPVVKTLKMMAAATVPLVMVSLGLMLEFSAFRQRRAWGPLAVVLLLKMAALPFLVWYVTGLVGITGIERQVAVTQSAMAPAMTNAVFAERYMGDRALVTMVIVLGTLLTAVTLPLWSLVAGLR